MIQDRQLLQAMDSAYADAFKTARTAGEDLESAIRLAIEAEKRVYRSYDDGLTRRWQQNRSYY